MRRSTKGKWKKREEGICGVLRGASVFAPSGGNSGLVGIIEAVGGGLINLQ